MITITNVTHNFSSRKATIAYLNEFNREHKVFINFGVKGKSFAYVAKDENNIQIAYRTMGCFNEGAAIRFLEAVKALILV